MFPLPTKVICSQETWFGLLRQIRDAKVINFSSCKIFKLFQVVIIDRPVPCLPFVRVHVIALVGWTQEGQDCGPFPRGDWPLKSEIKSRLRFVIHYSQCFETYNHNLSLILIVWLVRNNLCLADAINIESLLPKLC